MKKKRGLGRFNSRGRFWKFALSRRGHVSTENSSMMTSACSKSCHAYFDHKAYCKCPSNPILPDGQVADVPEGRILIRPHQRMQRLYICSAGY